MMRAWLFGVALAVAAGAAGAQETVTVPVETTEIEGNIATLRLYPFLTEEDVTLLRVVASNKETLAMFVPEGGGFAALAIAPKDGFIRDGQPVATAVAVGQLPDAASAAKSAIDQCNAARKRERDPECLVVLEVAPK